MLKNQRKRLFSVPSYEEIQACWELCRLQNGMGCWIVFLPTAFSIIMAYHSERQITALQAALCALKYVPLCLGVKSLIMTIDDILDADIDGLVQRTKNRALPRGAISLERAWVFFFLQVILGATLAYYCLSPTALWISVPVWPIFVIYPTCKRWMSLAPIPLGIMFNVGMFMGWADLSAQIGREVPWDILVPMYIGTCLWTFTYETVYQHQDKADDVKIGIRSAALLLGDYTKPVCTATAIGFFMLLTYGGILNGNGICFFAGIVFAAKRLLSLLSQTDIDKPRDCLVFFLDTVPVGKILLVGLILDAVVHRSTVDYSALDGL